MLNLTFHADFSGKQHEALLVSAGYLGTEKMWKRFSTEWDRALKEAQVRLFHATDFFSGQGEFKGWTNDPKKTTRFAKRFTAIARDNTTLGMALGMHMDGFRAVIAHDLKTFPSPKDRITGLMFCGTLLLSKLSRHIASLRADHMLRKEPIDIVFETEEGIGNCIEYWKWLKHRKREVWIQGFRSFTSQKKEVLALQAADLLAHECFRSAKEHYWSQGRQTRKSMSNLVRTGRVQFQVAEPDSFAGASERLRQFIARGGTTK